MKTVILVVLSTILSLVLTAKLTAKDWREASRESAGIAPLPEAEPEAVVQIYAARTINWRGWFAVHCWIATKEQNAEAYTTYNVMGWQLRRTGSTVKIQEDIPDRLWFGAVPSVVTELRGDIAAAAIPKIAAAAQTYPYNNRYRAWPGPNSNTFIAHIIRNVPELGVELPANAIGKDWLTNGSILAWSESGTGAQFSLFGALGLTVGAAEGLEVNVIGLTFGIDLLRPALKLPIIGRIGIKDAPIKSR